MAFALLVSLLAGLGASLALTAVAASFTQTNVAVMVGASGLSLFVIMPVWGWLQGEARFGRYAVTSILEVALRLAASIGAVLLGWGVIGAIGGFIVGAALVLICAGRELLRDLSWNPATLVDPARWRETGAIALVQVAFSALVSADVVFIAIVAIDSPAVAGYQAIATVAKGPVYVATGTTLVIFPLLRTASSADVVAIINSAMRTFLCLALPAAAVLGTIPPELAMQVLPARYSMSLDLLPQLAYASIGYATVGVLTVLLLAVRAYRRSLAGIIIAAICQITGILAGWRLDATHGLAVGVMIGSISSGLTLVVIAKPFLSWEVGKSAVRFSLLTGLLAGILTLTERHTVVWLGVTAMGVLAATRIAAKSASTHKLSRPTRLGPNGGLQIVHLGFEDPAMPGAGGGSLRTHEINRRLAAAGHEVTVLVTRFPGYADAVRDGVHYIHAGVGTGRTRLTRLVGYVIKTPFTARRIPADLVVEDFFAPISTMAAPLWTGRPTIGMVQWLNAREKSHQYHLPLHIVERFGVRRYHRLISVSAGVKKQLVTLNPAALVTIIGNGVDTAAFESTPRTGQDVVFVGRLEIAQKGLDLLISAWDLAQNDIDGQLIIAGTGPDEARLRTMVADRNLSHRVRFVGWISGQDKFDLLADARLAVVPSRFETFGIVALEALAASTPVLAFDIPCLREVVPEGCGQLIEPFNVQGFAFAMIKRYQDIEWLTAAGNRGRKIAAGYSWDSMAAEQLNVYKAAAVNTRTRTTISSNQPDRIGSIPQQIVRRQLADLTNGHLHKNRPPRITVIGNVGNGNTGDEALLSVVLASLSPDVEPTILSRRPDLVTSLHKVSAQPMTARGAAAALLRCDGLAIVGGGMFGPGLPPLVRLLPHVASVIAHTGRPVAYVGIGVYPGTPGTTLAALQRAARRGEITVRDELSLNILHSPRVVTCLGDLAWQLVPDSRALAENELDRAGVDLERPLLLVSAKAGTTEAKTAQLVSALTTAVTYWTSLGGSVACIALSDRTDRGSDRQLTDCALAHIVAAKSGIALPIVGPNLTPSLAKAITGRATVVLGLRFHSLVFAASMGTICMGFSWEPKTIALINELHLPRFNDHDALRSWLHEIITSSNATGR